MNGAGASGHPSRLAPRCKRTARLAPQDDGERAEASVGGKRRPELSQTARIYSRATGRTIMARKYSRKASADVERTMKKRKAGTLKRGRSKKKVKSRKQAIAIGLSEARAKGKKVPKKAAKKRKTAKKRKAKK